jgi:K+-sensing histidine kinase KdpD
MKRNQLIYVFILTLSVILFGGVNNYLLWYNIPVIPFGSFIIPFFPVAMTYLILKYQIMDIKMALRKSLVYSAVIVVITVLYMSIIFISSSVLQKLAGNNLWLNLLLVLLLALFLQPIKDFVQDKVDRLFDKKKLDYQEALAVAAKISRSFSNINSSLKVILHNIIDKMGLEKAEFYIINSKGDAYCNVDGTSTCELSRAIIECLKETKTYLVKEELVSHFVEFSRKSRTKIDRSAILADFNALQCSLVVPCFNEDKLDGFFSLGEKRSQDQFTKEDTRFMESIAGYVAMAIENEILLEKERATAEKIAQEKVASIVQTAVTFNHEINNPLTVIMSNAEILSKLIDQGSKLSTEFIQERMKLINQDSMKIKKIMEKMEKLTRPVVKEYLPGTAMLDVNALPDEPPPAK